MRVMRVRICRSEPAEVGAGFDEAFERLAALAYRVARRILVNGGDPENVAAETLARAQVRWRAVSDHAEPWVVTVASRLAVREARRVRRSPTGRGSDRVPDRADDVIVRMDLGRALQRLSPRQRLAVALRFLGELSDRECALAMGCSVPSFRTHCSRGLAALQVQLQAIPAWASDQQEGYRT
jgi:RNA polymerase sigma factor (sigma-70 family)